MFVPIFKRRTYLEINRQGVLNVDKHASIVFGYLIEKDRTITLRKDDSSVLGHRQNGILEDSPDEVTLGGRLAGGIAHDDVPKIGEAAISNHYQVPVDVERFLNGLGSVQRNAGGLGDNSDADDLIGERAFDEIGSGRFNGVNVVVCQSDTSQAHDEAAVVEAAALLAFWVRNLDGLTSLDEEVARYRDGVDAFERGRHAQRLQSLDAARLEELANNPVRFREGTLDQSNSEGRRSWDGCKGMGKRRSCHASTNNDDVVSRVLHDGEAADGILGVSWTLEHKGLGNGYLEEI